MKLIKKLLLVSIQSATLLLFIFSINLVFNKEWNGWPNKPKINKIRQDRRKNKAMEERWYFIEEREPPIGVLIIVELNKDKFFRLIKTKIKRRHGLNYIKRWRFLTEEERQLEQQVSAYRKQGKKTNLW